MAIYLLVYSITLLCFISKKKILQNVGFIVLCLFTVLRYDVGNDYDNYFYGIESTANSFREHHYLDAIIHCRDLASIIIIFLCQYFPKPQLFVIGIYGVLSLILFRKSLFLLPGEKNLNLFWGFLGIYLLTIYPYSLNAIRQSVSIGAFCVSIKYIQKANIKRYLSLILIAFAFHTSAIILFPLYLIRKFKIGIILKSVVLIILTLGAFTGSWSPLFEKIKYFSVFYEGMSDTYLNAVEMNSGLGFLLKVILYFSIILVCQKKFPIISNIIFISLCLYLFSSSVAIFERIAFYLMFVSYLAIPLIMERRNISTQIIFQKYFISLTLLIYGGYETYKGAYGILPYKTIFSREIEYHNFKIRDYRNSINIHLGR